MAGGCFSCPRPSRGWVCEAPTIAFPTPECIMSDMMTTRQPELIVASSIAMAHLTTGCTYLATSGNGNGSPPNIGIYQPPRDPGVNVWRDHEFPVLQASPAVTEILNVDASQKYAQTIDWTRAQGRLATPLPMLRKRALTKPAPAACPIRLKPSRPATKSPDTPGRTGKAGRPLPSAPKKRPTRAAAPASGTREPPWRHRAGARCPPTAAVDPVLCPSKSLRRGVELHRHHKQRFQFGLKCHKRQTGAGKKLEGWEIIRVRTGTGNCYCCNIKA
ncbi:hypothetical protein PspLS_11613 [Pyricularia sp. CBS 133598]|nr:hypothetical protein PspLS_11613 [Pyricularia sp. CBS 133598]